MPRTSKYPRLRVRVRKGKGGQVWTSYFYDMRSQGKPDIALGTDYAAALSKWEELHLNKSAYKGTLAEAFDRWEREVLPTYTSDETRSGYARHLKRLRPSFGPATWESVTFPHLKQYLKLRSAKTQGNRELALLSIVWNWARGEGLSAIPWPAAGMERSRWKNKEKPRKFEVTDELFNAVYLEADQLLKDCMDLASATGLRLTDCRTIALPRDAFLRFEASKTGKLALYDISESAVLPGIVERRRQVSVSHDFLLSSPTGIPLSARMLRDHWDEARSKAAEKNPHLADQIKKMFLRDMRKRASDLVETVEDAAKLLQHSNLELTRRHYRTRGERVKPVR